MFIGLCCPLVVAVSQQGPPAPRTKPAHAARRSCEPHQLPGRGARGVALPQIRLQLTLNVKPLGQHSSERAASWAWRAQHGGPRFRFERGRRSESTDLARQKTPRRWARDKKIPSCRMRQNNNRVIRRKRRRRHTLGLTESDIECCTPVFVQTRHLRFRCLLAQD